MARTIDFDAARAERQREPVRLRIGGEWYDLGAGLPASIALDLIRFKAAEGEGFEIPEGELDGMGRRLFGADNWVAILDRGRLELEEMGDLIRMTVEALQGRDGQDDDPPNRGSRRAAGSRASAGSTTGR